MDLTPTQWNKVQALFHQAIERPAEERRAYLEAECDEPDIIAQVLALIEQDGDTNALLGGSLGDVARSVLSEPEAVPRTIGAYRVLRQIGEGGMGVVFLGEREDLGSQATIKVLRDATLSPARRERFEQEEQLLAGLHHPSIAQLYDADVLPDGTPYFVMEYVEGRPITDYCDEKAHGIRERLRLFRSVCQAVAYAHRHLVVHRDLKPSNILVGEENGKPVVKLLDFGIAKSIERLDEPAEQTRTGLRLMTPAYAAPEQLSGAAVGVHTDVYALGVLLYQLLSGSLPFDLTGLTPGQAEMLILDGEPERPSVRAANHAVATEDPLSTGRRSWADLDVLCLKAMNKEPERRYETAEALIRDIDHFLAREPLDARPDTFGYKASKFLRRNRRAVGATALVGVALIVLSAFYAVRLAEERSVAENEADKAEQVSDYLISLFEAGDPYGADSFSVAALLEQGVEQAESLADQPAVQAQMLDVLGRVYILLSEYERADSLLGRALNLRREYGEPLEVAETLINQGELFIYMAENDRAAQATREALALREQHLPAAHPDIATALDNLGIIIGREGDHETAESFLRRSLLIRRALYDEPHEDLGYSLNNLAVNLYRQRDYVAAERYYREAIEVDRAVFGPGHASVATGLANLGKLLEEQEHYAAAESLLTEALQIRRATLGEDHYETALSLSQLGRLLQVKGDLDRAEGMLREALARRERILGPDHTGTTTTRNHLAITLQRQGNFQAAEPLLEQVLQAYRENPGEDHWFTGVAHCNLAELYHLTGRANESEDAYRTGLAILREALPNDHHVLAYNESRFGATLAARSNFAEAETLLLDGLQKLRAHHGPNSRDSQDAADRIVELYEAWGKPEEAAEYRVE